MKVQLLVFLSLCLHVANARDKGVKLPPKPIDTYITGYCPKYINTPIEISLSFQDKLNAGETITINKTITKGGRFEFKFPLKGIRIINIELENTPVFFTPEYYINGGPMISPGDSLHLDVRNNIRDGFLNINFSGRGYQKAIFMQDLMIREHSEIRPKSPKDGGRKDILAYMKYMNMRLSLVNEMLERYLPIFTERELVFAKTRCLSDLYYTLFPLMLSKDLSDPSIQALFIQMDKQFMMDTFYTNAHYEDAASAGILYVGLIKEYALLQYCLNNSSTYSDARFRQDKILTYEILKGALKDKPIKEFILYDYLKTTIRFAGLDSQLVQCAYKYIEETKPASAFRQKIQTLVKEMNENNIPGTIAYNFSLPDTLGALHTMSDFKGKVVLLDFMFYGCEGCAELAPIISEMEDSFGDSNLICVSISIDKKLASFKNAAGRYTSKNALALYTNGLGTDHPVLKHYNIQGYPTLLLIDRRGRLIFGRAPDPRSPNGRLALETAIRNALKREM